jgi:serpin B
MMQTTLLILCACVAGIHGHLSDASNEFAINLYGSLADTIDDGNLFFSPISINLALGMTYMGARGNTQSQMNQFMALDELIDEDIPKSYQQLIASLDRTDKNYTLNIANRLFGKQDYVFEESFLEDTEEYFSSQLEELDFAGAPEESRVHINDWVADHTQQKIKDLIPGGAIDEMTRLVIVNAIYFKAGWKFPFDEGDTEIMPFTNIKGEKQDVEMMQMSDTSFNYKEDALLNAKILEIPYKGDDASMFIILPDDEQSLRALEDDLADADLKVIFSSGFTNGMVKVTIPKFEMTQQMSLKSLLMDLGMKDLFIPGLADLSGINGQKDLSVTEIVHKAYIKVDEVGTEAAGATGVIVGITAILNKPEFKADHPFMYVVWEKHTNTALFMGRFATHPSDTTPYGAFGA